MERYSFKTFESYMQIATIGADPDRMKWIMLLIKGTSVCPHSTPVPQDYADPSSYVEPRLLYKEIYPYLPEIQPEEMWGYV
jgi:hypothetical protein